MIKSLIPTLSKEVGRSTALVFQQLIQWFKGHDVVYRTNQELADDLEGILSVATIQRAKQKLIEAGYLTVSFDKGLKRTTHYRLTEKAHTLLQGWKDAAKKKVEEVKKAVQGVTKPKKQAPKPKEPSNNFVGEAGTKSMQEAFSEYGTAPKGKTAMPEALARLGRFSKQKKSAPIEGTESNESVDMGSVVASVFKKGVTAAQERIYNMKQAGANFNEDF